MSIQMQEVNDLRVGKTYVVKVSEVPALPLFTVVEVLQKVPYAGSQEQGALVKPLFSRDCGLGGEEVALEPTAIALFRPVGVTAAKRVERIGLQYDQLRKAIFEGRSVEEEVSAAPAQETV